MAVQLYMKKGIVVTFLEGTDIIQYTEGSDSSEFNGKVLIRAADGRVIAKYPIKEFRFGFVLPEGAKIPSALLPSSG